MVTEYCSNCGFLHDIDDGDCMGCVYGNKIAEQKERIKLLNKELLKRCSFKEFKEVEKEIDSILEIEQCL